MEILQPWTYALTSLINLKQKCDFRLRCNLLKKMSQIIYSLSCFNVYFLCMFRLYFLFSGYRHRVRSILISPTNGGKPCPHVEEVDSCGDPDFFGWQYGNWSECTTRKDEKCGPGKMTRDITCVKWNGVIDSIYFFIMLFLYKAVSIRNWIRAR